MNQIANRSDRGAGGGVAFLSALPASRIASPPEGYKVQGTRHKAPASRQGARGGSAEAERVELFARDETQSERQTQIDRQTQTGEGQLVRETTLDLVRGEHT